MAHEAFLDQLGCSPILTRILQNWNHYITKIFIKKRVKGDGLCGYVVYAY
jgi:hypothetical protein